MRERLVIQANISEIKNRLSYYLRLVRGGNQIVIMDRKTPLARIIHVSQGDRGNPKAPWIKELERMGVVNPPATRELPKELLDRRAVVLLPDRKKAAVLNALLEERDSGR